MASDRITLAAIAGAHGIGGEVRLKLFAETIDNLSKATVEVGGSDARLQAVRTTAQGAIARVEGVSSRDAAEALRGALVTVDRSALPPPEEGEYYWADLIGLDCVSFDGEHIGRIANVENYGAGDLLEVARPDHTRFLVPFRGPAALLDGGRIRIDPAFLA